MIKTLAIAALCALLALAPAVSAAAQPITAEEWARPRDGASLAAMDPVREALQALAAAPGAVLLVRYPPGESGLLWAEELQSWLVALGLSSRRLRSAADSPSDDAIYLEVLAEGNTVR